MEQKIIPASGPVTVEIIPVDGVKGFCSRQLHPNCGGFRLRGWNIKKCRLLGVSDQTLRENGMFLLNIPSVTIFSSNFNDSMNLTGIKILQWGDDDA